MAGHDTSKAEEKGLSRRSFLTGLWIMLGFAALAEFVAVVVSFLRSRRARVKIDAGVVLEAGPVVHFQPGSVTAFVRGKFYLCCLDDGGFLAVSRSCTHLGCTVPWSADDRKFICPCHASTFDITGAVITPPASRPLDLYQVSIENSMVKVDTRKRIRRSSFGKEQIVYPKKT